LQVQSYEKSSAKQKNSFFFLPRRRNFAIVDGKVTKKRVKCKRKDHFSFAFPSENNFGEARVTKSRVQRHVNAPPTALAMCAERMIGVRQVL
jgi:hypothetical protein